jgi:ribosome-binding factor A
MGETDRSRAFDPGTDRKTLQLCRQIHRALMMAAGDELPGNVSVDSVEPMGTATQLLVRVIVNESTPAALAEAMDQLNRRAAPLRALICRSIHRKRAPALHFVAMPRDVGSNSGGEMGGEL